MDEFCDTSRPIGLLPFVASEALLFFDFFFRLEPQDRDCNFHWPVLSELFNTDSGFTIGFS